MVKLKRNAGKDYLEQVVYNYNYNPLSLKYNYATMA